MVARRLEFMPDNVWLWKKLWKLLKNQPAAVVQQRAFWQERLVWWPAHFFSTDVIPPDDSLLLWRCLASIYLLGDGNPFLQHFSPHLQSEGCTHPSLPGQKKQDTHPRKANKKRKNDAM